MQRFVFTALLIAGCAAPDTGSRASIDSGLGEIDVEVQPTICPEQERELQAALRMAARVDRLVLMERTLGPPSPGTADPRARFHAAVAAADKAVAHYETQGAFGNPEARRILAENVIEPLRILGASQ